MIDSKEIQNLFDELVSKQHAFVVHRNALHANGTEYNDKCFECTKLHREYKLAKDLYYIKVDEWAQSMEQKKKKVIDG